MQAFARNCRNQSPDAKGEAQAAKTVRREYQRRDWDGSTRSSVEGPVMGLERRGRVRLSYYWNNWKQDDVNGYDKQAVSNR